MIRKKIRKTNFFQAHNLVFDLKTKNQKGSLHNYVKIVYLYLCKCADEKLESFPSYATIGINCSISKRTAQDVVTNLIEFGLVSKVNRYKFNKNLKKVLKDSNMYQVNEYLLDGTYESAIFLIKNNLINDKAKNRLWNKYNLTEDIIDNEELIFDDLEEDLESEEKEAKNIVDDKIVDNIYNDFLEIVPNNPLNKVLLKNLLQKVGKQKVEKYLKDWKKYMEVKSMNDPAKYFYTCIKKEIDIWDEMDAKKHIIQNNNGKPIQATNYEQRKYDDEFFENLYDNFK